MSAHFLLTAIKEARYETIAQRLRIEELLQKVQQLETENAALREDKERLDWLARNRSVSATELPLSVTLELLRAAIDAARAKEAKL